MFVTFQPSSLALILRALEMSLAVFFATL
jgi:hypothetical protein